MKIFNCPWVMRDLKRQCGEHLKQLKNGKSARDVAVDVYRTMGSDEAVANTMVDCIEKMIKEYHMSLMLTTEDMIKRKLDAEIEWAKTPEARCEVYHRALVTLGAYEIMNSGDAYAQGKAEDFVQKHESFAFAEGENLEQKEKEMRAAVEEAFLKTPVPVNSLDAFFDDRKFDPERLECPGVEAVFGEGSAELKLILCTQAYVDYIEGCCGNEDASLTMEQLVNAVCAGVDLNAIVRAKDGKGEAVERILRLLYCVLVVAAFAVIPSMLFTIFTFCMSIPWAIAALIGCFVLFGIANDEYRTILKHVGLCFVDAVALVLEGIYDLFRLVCKGIRKAVNCAVAAAIRFFSPGSPPAGAGAAAALAKTPVPEKNQQKESEKEPHQAPTPIYF